MHTTHLSRNTRNNDRRIENINRELRELRVTFESGRQVLQQQITHLSKNISGPRFNKGDIVCITNNYKGKFGLIGKILKVMKNQASLELIYRQIAQKNLTSIEKVNTTSNSPFAQ